MTNKDKIIEKFKAVKKLGYVKSNRRGNTGIGKTFEDYVGVVENNANKPDLFGYEIKSHRDNVQNYITLFTKCPSFPKGANSYLKNKFGTPYDDNQKLKRIHTSIFANKVNNYGQKYSFKLIDNQEEQCIYIAVYSQKTKKLLNCSCGYTYSDLEKTMRKKLKKLFYVKAKIKKNKDGVEKFWFNQAEIYEKASFKNFLKLLNDGLIMYDIRIGSYQSGTKYGKTHDHGSGFRILEKNLSKLYSEYETIE